MRLKEKRPSGLTVYHPSRRKIGVRSPLNSYTGYGLHASYTVRWLANAGYDVRVQPLAIDDTVFSDIKSFSQEPCPETLLIAPVTEKVQPNEWFFTMHETTQLPKETLENVRRAQAIIVPSRWCQQCFDAQNVGAPVYVVPIGVNLGLFFPAKRRPAMCVFGSAGNIAMSIPERKNLDLLLAAFHEAFPDEKDVRLSIKVRPECPVPPVTDTRVEVIREQMSEGDLGDWYRRLSAYVSPSRGEAFGQMNLQAMACGVPVVCCAFGGVTDYHSGYNVEFKLVRPQAGYYQTGLWAEPDMDSLVEQMRRVYEDRSEADGKGMVAAQVASRYDWSAVTAKLEGVLKSGGFWKAEWRAPRTPVETAPAPIVQVVQAPAPPPPSGINYKSPWNNEATPPVNRTPFWLARRTAGHEPVFYMSGDLGDIVYAMPTIRAFGGGQLCIGPARDHSYYWLREPMTPARYAVISPLLEFQKDYLSRVFWSDDMGGWRCHVDLNDSRRLHREPYYIRERNLADVASCYFGLGPGLWREAWLKVDQPKRVARFVFARSQRYHKPDFPWKEIVQKHAKEAVFVGIKDEYDEFVAECGHVVFYPTRDLLELARVLAGCEWLVANQSCPMAVAEGLKGKIVREHFADAPNCIYPREGHTDNPACVLDLC